MLRRVQTEANEELVPCLSAGLPDAKEILAQLTAAEIPATLERDACCGAGCGHTPKMMVLVAPADVPRVVGVLRDRWRDMLEREGVDPELFDLGAPATAAPGAEATADGEPPCPACGTAAPLVEGACSDCGLQLA